MLTVNDNNVVGIYGANASGKSNLIAALNEMLLFIKSKTIDSHDKNREPFKLNAEWRTEPSIFKIEFIVDKLQYEYRIVIFQDEIKGEVLDSLLHEKRTNLYVRTENIVRFKEAFHPTKNFMAKPLAFQSCLFALAKEGNKQALSICNYFKQYRVFVASKLSRKCPLVLYIDNLVKEDAALKLQLDRMLQLSGLQVDYTHTAHKDFNNIISQDLTTFDLLEKESSGTVKLYYLGAAILAALKQKSVLIVDDISSSLHTKLCSFLVKLFRNCKSNPHNSQLIFTSHRSDLMGSSQLEEVYFTEKDKYGATHLFAASDFDGVTNETPLDRWYLQGKFGATPNIKEISFIYEDQKDVRLNQI